jgi:hypothetical protein
MTCDIIGKDLGILSSNRPAWDKYITPVALGLLWAFYFANLQRKRKAALSGKPIDEST